jgi:hypothetical protein
MMETLEWERTGSWGYNCAAALSLDRTEAHPLGEDWDGWPWVEVVWTKQGLWQAEDRSPTATHEPHHGSLGTQHRPGLLPEDYGVLWHREQGKHDSWDSRCGGSGLGGLACLTQKFQEIACRLQSQCLSTWLLDWSRKEPEAPWQVNYLSKCYSLFLSFIYPAQDSTPSFRWDR